MRTTETTLERLGQIAQAPLGVHYNIQLSVQRVEVTEKPTAKPSLPRAAGAETSKHRTIQKVLDLSVTAANEEEAYEKIRRLLAAAEPDRSSELRPL
jgi:hypothetical protein